MTSTGDISKFTQQTGLADILRYRFVWKCYQRSVRNILFDLYHGLVVVDIFERTKVFNEKFNSRVLNDEQCTGTVRLCLYTHILRLTDRLAPPCLLNISTNSKPITRLSTM